MCPPITTGNMSLDLALPETLMDRVIVLGTVSRDSLRVIAASLVMDI
jgi:hypothetical protein